MRRAAIWGAPLVHTSRPLDKSLAMVDYLPMDIDTYGGAMTAKNQNQSMGAYINGTETAPELAKLRVSDVAAEQTAWQRRLARGFGDPAERRPRGRRFYA